jgi:Fic family protein
MNWTAFMHPIIALRRLDGLQREIATVLASAKSPIAQVEIIDRLRRKVSQSTVSRALGELLDAKIVVKTGTTRNSAFGLSPETSRFALPPHLRKPVDYDPKVLGGYKANETHWLPERAETRMREAAASMQHQLDASTYSQQIAERFLIDLSWASSAFEGNTYDYLETEALIKFGSAASGHDVAEATMIMNHKKAIITLLEQLDDEVLNVQSVSRIHALLMRESLSHEELGRMRRRDVRIGSSAYRPSGEFARLPADLGGLLWQAERVENPFEASFLLLTGIPYLQPFEDGNKRTGRLMCNVPLLKAGLPPMSFIAVDKADYLAGLIAFYETNDTVLLADVVADGYAAAAPSYAAAVSAGRRPRSVELRERQGIDEAIRSIVSAALDDGSEDVDAEVAKRFSHLNEEDRQAVTESVATALQALNEINAGVWGVSPVQAAQFAERRSLASESSHGM